MLMDVNSGQPEVKDTSPLETLMFERDSCTNESRTLGIGPIRLSMTVCL